MGRLLGGLGGCFNGFLDGGCKDDEGFLNIVIILVVLFFVFTSCNSKCR